MVSGLFNCDEFASFVTLELRDSSEMRLVKWPKASTPCLLN